MNRIPSISPTQTLMMAGLAAALVGCDRNEIKVYQAPKEVSASSILSNSVMVVEPPAQPKLSWTLPEGWLEVPAGQMRLASFAVKGLDGKAADVSIVPLGGSAGGDLSNVIRWRGQVGLGPVTEEELGKLGEKVEVAGAEAKLFDFAGAQSRILVTTLQRDGMSWFFKMSGDGDLIGQQKENFVAFLKSVKFNSETAALSADHSPVGGTDPALPSDHPSIGEMSTVVSSADPAKPEWTVPSTWTEEAPTQMLLAKFSASEKDTRAEITVSSFPGDVGGFPANINLWRRQIGLPPMDEAAATQAAKPIEVRSEKASLVELDGKSSKLVGVILPHGGQTWFFKMMGDEKVVAREKDAFIKFVEGVKLPHAP